MTVSPLDLTIQEGATGTYTVVLNTQPTATVTISVTARDDASKCHSASGASCTRKSGVATVDKSSLTFTTTDWNQAQTVTVTATEEDMAGFFKHAEVTHGASGGDYGALSVSEVRVTVTDNDLREIVYETGSPGNLQARSSLGTYEGSSHSYYVSLESEPTAATTVALASEDSSRVTVSPTSLTFTTTNWNVAQPVSSDVADNDVLGEDRVQVTITSTISGTGSNYDGQSVRPFTVNVYDNDLTPRTVTAGDSFSHEFSWDSYPGAYLLRAESVGGAATIAPHTVQVTEANYQKVSFSVTGVDAGQAKINFRIGAYLWRSFLVTVLPPPIPRRLTLGANRRAAEGGPNVTITATLDSPAPAGGTDVTLRVGPESTATLGDDYTLSRTAFTIAEGERTGAAILSVIDDADDDDGETVYLSAESRNPELSSTGLRLDIRDNDLPAVTLSARPNPVQEGLPVTVTARLSSALSSGVTIPLTLTAGTAEEDDYGSLSGVEISAGSTSGTGEISTSEDEDRDNETFTVSLGSLPSSLRTGSPSSVAVTIWEPNEAPTLTASCDPCQVGRGGEVRLTAEAWDPDGDALTYAWSAPTGSFLGAADEPEARWQAPADTGTVLIDVNVRDGLGGSASAAVVVEVVNEAPVFTESSFVFELRENQDGRSSPVMLGVATVEDPDGDEVTCWLASGDGTRFAVGAQDGVVFYVGAGEDFETEPNQYRLMVRASDRHGGTAVVEVTVEVTNVNEAPVAAADTAATDEDEPVTVDVLANDSDVDGDNLRIESVSQPANGTARIAEGGRVGYAPEANWHGTDRFAYTAADGNGGTGTAEVVVVVAAVNDAPVAVADTAATDEDEPVTVDVLENDRDVDGDALSIESISAPAHGTAQVTADRVLYAPDGDWHGTDRFAYTVADRNGGTAQAEVIVVVAAVNDAPVAVGAIPDQALEEGGATATLDLEPYFEDPDGDTLTYAAASSNPNVAGVIVAGSVLTVTPVAYGPASIEVTAYDPGGLSAVHTFAVDADDRMVRMALDETLAATARAHLASARMTLGRRVGPAGGDERSQLTVRGRSIPLDKAAVRTATERLFAGWTLSRYLRGGGLAGAGRTFERQAVEWAAAATGGRDGPAAAPRDPADLLAAVGVGSAGGLRGFGDGGGGTEFAFALGGGDSGGRGWRLWGQGDIQTFAGEPAAERGYEGDLRTGWAGLDRTLGESWLAGVAVAKSKGGGDWRAGAAEGRLETSLTAVHPYLRWSGGGTSVWAMAGGGWGSAENARATGGVGTSDLDLGLGLLEVRRRFANWFRLRADAAWARLATGEGTETVDGRSAAVEQQRLGIEVSTSKRLGRLALKAFGEASGRRDGGAGQTGTGLELAGGLRAASGPGVC
ncbi:Ig-like domain-containing protein [Candidatus Palauibacter sp.]|uniref:Ig-like domain-containing protein n=1 Tax=Candidatus Palauibacter sp. TaxID=3101350 RepID=UPI003B526D04